MERSNSKQSPTVFSEAETCRDFRYTDDVTERKRAENPDANEAYLLRQKLSIGSWLGIPARKVLYSREMFEFSD